MSHHEVQKIRKKLAPFMSLLLAVACMGLLASCGGGSGTGSTENSNTPSADASYTKVVNESDFVTAPNGATAVNNQLLLDVNNGVAYQTVIDYINQNNWTLVGYVSGAGMYQVDVGATDWATAKSNAEKSGLFYLVSYNRKAKFDAITSRWNDPLLQSLIGRWNLDAINIDQAYSILNQNPSGYTKVAVIDGGFRTDHQDISFASVQNSAGQNVNQATGCSLSFPLDNYSCSSEAKKSGANHGMNVAGIIAGAQNNNIGVAGISSRFVQLSGYEFQSYADIVGGIQKSIVDGNKVINLSVNQKIIEYEGVSMSGGVYSIPPAAYDAYRVDAMAFGQRLFNILKTYDKDEKVLLVKSSGNDADAGISVNGSSYAKIPSRYNGLHSAVVSPEFIVDAAIRQRIARQTIFVGAFHMDSGTKSLANYTELPDTDTLISGNFILAPGGSRVSGGATPGVLSAGYTKSYNSDYFYLTAGTSQATPHVTGVAALLWQANPNLSASEVRDIILTNSDTVDGYRALNAEKAVRAAIDTLTKPTVTLAVSTTTPQLGQAVAFTATASSSNGAIKVYSWSFGDGTTLTGQTSPTTTHAYSATGDYAVTVTVTDEKGASSTSTAVHILPVSPVPTPTVTGITAPGTLTAGVNATFSINGSNLPTGENLLITPSGVGCTGFGYGTRSATAHTFACTPSAAGTLTFTIATAGGVSLGSRDVTVSASSTEKYSLVSNGAGGFYDKTECVKDTVTGLIWEGKTASGLRSTYSYTNYNSSVAGNMQRWNGQGTAIYDATANDVAASTNSIGYVNYVNQLNLCGLGAGWRVPTKDELMGLVDASVANGQKINQNWFPNTGQYYWSSSPNTENATYTVYGWAVDFNSGSANAYYARYNNLYIRLVRAGQ